MPHACHNHFLIVFWRICALPSITIFLLQLVQHWRDRFDVAEAVLRVPSCRASIFEPKDQLTTTTRSTLQLLSSSCFTVISCITNIYALDILYYIERKILKKWTICSFFDGFSNVNSFSLFLLRFLIQITKTLSLYLGNWLRENI